MGKPPTAEEPDDRCGGTRRMDVAATRGAAAPPTKRGSGILEFLAKLWLIVLILVAISIPFAAMLGWL
jgi:hypothetical protein